MQKKNGGKLTDVRIKEEFDGFAGWPTLRGELLQEQGGPLPNAAAPLPSMSIAVLLWCGRLVQGIQQLLGLVLRQQHIVLKCAIIDGRHLNDYWQLIN